jgi:hypothetical protein
MLPVASITLGFLRFPGIPELVAQSLSHRAGGKVALSYRRGDLLAKRRRLLDAWARYLASPAKATADVLPLVQPTRS